MDGVQKLDSAAFSWKEFAFSLRPVVMNRSQIRLFVTSDGQKWVAALIAVCVVSSGSGLSTTEAGSGLSTAEAGQIFNLPRRWGDRIVLMKRYICVELMKRYICTGRRRRCSRVVWVRVGASPTRACDYCLKSLFMMRLHKQGLL